MGERSGHRPGTDLGIAFPNEYAVRTAHWRHPCDQNYNGAPSRAQTKCTFHHTFVHSTRTISAEGCSRANLETRITMGKRKSTKPCHQNYNGGTHRAHQKCTFHHTFARSTRTISAEGCSRTNAIRVSPHARAIDGHDSTRGLRFVRPARTAPPPKEKNKEEVG